MGEGKEDPLDYPPRLAIIAPTRQTKARTPEGEVSTAQYPKAVVFVGLDQMKAPYFLLLIPTALSALAYFLWSDVEWVTTFSSNLGAGFLGSFLTVLLVERALERHKEQEVRRIRNVGLGQLRAPLGQHLTLLAEWYKAALPASVPLPSTFEHFFGDDFYEHVRRLDFSRAAPTWATSPPLDWFQRSGQELERFRRQLERVIDKYVASLEPTLIELVEGLANSDFMNV